jgi:hypothetical protein
MLMVPCVPIEVNAYKEVVCVRKSSSESRASSWRAVHLVQKMVFVTRKQENVRVVQDIPEKRVRKAFARTIAEGTESVHSPPRVKTEKALARASPDGKVPLVTNLYAPIFAVVTGLAERIVHVLVNLDGRLRQIVA